MARKKKKGNKICPAKAWAMRTYENGQLMRLGSK